MTELFDSGFSRGDRLVVESQVEENRPQDAAALEWSELKVAKNQRMEAGGDVTTRPSSTRWGFARHCKAAVTNQVRTCLSKKEREFTGETRSKAP